TLLSRATPLVADGAGNIRRAGLALLAPMSEVAGKLASQAGAFILEKPFGGRGLLLVAVPGVAPGGVVILGGGIVGYNAAIIALGLGRSEERRVGEEWRSRGAARALKTKGGRSAGMRTADGRQGDD